MSPRSFTIALRDYVDVVELRMRATILATACGLGPHQQGLVALAVTDAAVFALQHVGPSAAELRVEEDASAPCLMVVVRGDGSPDASPANRLPPIGEDGDLILAERAAERFSVSSEPSTGTRVTMGWALPPEVRRLGEHEADVDLIRRLTGDLETANRELAGLHWELELAREGEACLATILQFSAEAMFSMNPSLVLTSWNPGAERLLGHSADEMIGMPVEPLILEGALGDFGVALGRLAAGEPMATYETFRRRQEGSLVEATVTVSTMRNAAGLLIGYSVVLRDLDDRGRPEKDLPVAAGGTESSAEMDRMASDLRDLVMQRLFACGMTLPNTLLLDPRRSL